MATKHLWSLTRRELIPCPLICSQRKAFLDSGGPSAATWRGLPLLVEEWPWTALMTWRRTALALLAASTSMCLYVHGIDVDFFKIRIPWNYGFKVRSELLTQCFLWFLCSNFPSQSSRERLSTPLWKNWRIPIVWQFSSRDHTNTHLSRPRMQFGMACEPSRMPWMMVHLFLVLVPLRWVYRGGKCFSHFSSFQIYASGFVKT